MKFIKSFKFWAFSIVVLYTFLGFIILPWFITNKLPPILKDKIGLNITISDTSFNPYSFELTLQDITIRNQSQRAVLKVKKAYVNYTIFGFFTKTFLFSNISINSPKIFVTINQDGKLNLATILPKSKASKQAKTSEKQTLPSIMLRVIKIKDGQIIIKDKRENKNFQANLGPYHFIAHDISTDKGELNAYTFKTLINNQSTLFWKGGMSINPLKLYGKIQLSDLKLPKLYMYVLPKIPAYLKSGSLSFTLPYQINLSKGIKAKILNAKLVLSNLDLKDKTTNDTLINAKTISINDFNLDWPKQSVLVDNFQITDTNIYSKLEKNGQVNLVEAFGIKPNNKKEIDSKPSKKWTYLLKNAKIEKTSIYFDNLNLKKPTKTSLKQIALQISNISSNKQDLIKYKLSSKLNSNSDIKISGSVTQEPLNTISKVELSNILPTDFINYINPYINFKLKNANINMTAQINAKLGEQKDIVFKADTSINNLTINTKNDKKLLKWKKLAISGLSVKWPKQSARIDNISLYGVDIDAQLQKNGDMNLLKAFMPKLTKKTVKKTGKTKPWKYLVKEVDINSAKVAFLDKTLDTSTKNTLSNIDIKVKKISSNKKMAINYQISNTLNTKSKMKFSGKVIQKPLRVISKIRLQGIEVADFRNYLSPYVNMDIKKASINLDAQLNAKLGKKPNINVLATASINNLAINSADDQKLLRWKKLLISGIKFKNTPMQINIKSIKLDKPYIRVHITKNRSTNFTNLIKKQKNKNKKTESKETIKLKIGPIKLINGTTNFSDASLPFPFHTLIHDLNGDISTLDFSSTTPSKIKLDGKIDKYGYANIKGLLLPFRIKQRADIDILLKNLDLTNLTPYSGKFLGYKIKNGKLSMDLNYKISKSSLIGKNKINIDTLDLGETVKSKDAVSLPLKLALALLKDSNNQIDINLPVMGNMNNPDFSYGGIVWKAVGNMITGLVTAPFKFLGSLLGIKGDDLKSIDFEKGSSTIISTEVEKLVNLYKIMGKRPNIKLEIVGGWDRVFDTQELQKQAFEKIINNELEKIKKDGNKTAIDNYGKALKILYAKKFTNSKYEKLKKSFMIIPKTDDNTTKKAKKAKTKAKLDITYFNYKMREKLTKTIKISDTELVSLANKRAHNIKNALVQKYKIDEKRLKILPPKSTKAKRDRWIMCELKISI
ncbi:MAG: DUF748 domain-containing protein [Campylobacteraceae bacterium]|nr:DUF748 domain-containing protein [Campylobacteraceae bacterium]